MLFSYSPKNLEALQNDIVKIEFRVTSLGKDGMSPYFMLCRVDVIATPTSTCPDS